MADNYLEKRYDEVFGKGGGRNSGPQRPSLDVLVRRQDLSSGFDPSYRVHPLQLESVITTLRGSKTFEGLSFEAVTGDHESGIRISGTADPLLLGECIAIIKLKATELGLGGSYSGNGFVIVGKPLHAGR